MDVNPRIAVERFEKIAVGALFHFSVDDLNTLAIKTLPYRDGEKSELLILGPGFPQQSNESCLLKWQPTTVVNYGLEYTVVLPTSSSAWDYEGQKRRTPVSLALCGNDVFVSTNGGTSPQHFEQFYVHLKTGKIVNRIDPIAAFTNEWEIIVLGPDARPCSLLRFPLRLNGKT